jgi:hypothetical protein
MPAKGNRPFSEKFNLIEAGRALQKHTDAGKRTTAHVANYLPVLRGANRLTDKAALNAGGRELIGDLLGSTNATRTLSAAPAHYGGQVLEVFDSVSARGARWSTRGGQIQFEGFL